MKTWRIIAAVLFALSVALVPTATAQQGGQAGQGTEIEIEFHVIGFAVDQSTAQQLQQVAEAAGGQYYDAQNQQELEVAFGQGIGVSTAPAVTEEEEANDSFSQANPIALSGTVSGAIDPRRDADWYEVHVDRAGELKVEITKVAAELDIVFRVWNADKQVLADWQGPAEKGGDVDTFVDLPGPGRYVLEVRDGRDDAASAQPYQIQTRFTPVVDAGEPNNSIGTAAALTLGTEVQAHILPRRDHDWYRFDVPGRAELHVLVSDVASNLDIAFRVWDREKQVVLDWQSPRRAGGDTEAIVDFWAAGTYYLELADSRDDQRSPEPYTLETTLTTVVDAGERNDSFGTAQLIALDQALQGTILPRRDHDWYRFDVPGRAELHVLVSDVAPDLDIVFRVWDREKQVVLDWQAPLRAGGDTEAIVDFWAAGTYYLELADSRDDQRSAEPYSLETTLTPVVDAGERNDSFGSAQRIQIGQTLQGSILPRRDHDWYSIVVPQQGELQVEITDSPDNLDLVFRVWNADKQVVLDWQAPLRTGGDVSGAAEITEPGLYTIEVADGRDSDRSPSPYTLTATLGAP